MQYCLEFKVSTHSLNRLESLTVLNFPMGVDVPAWKATAYAGVTAKALEDNYGDHWPAHHARARKVLG